jgi:type I restriction enzyme S subunit
MKRNRVFLHPKFISVGQDASKYSLLSLTTNGIILRDVESGKGKFPKDFDSYQVVESNDIVFCLFDVDETPRTVGLSSLNGMLTGAYDAFSIADTVNPRFINYYYTAVDDIKALRPYYTGLRKVVKKDKFMAISIPIPPIEEQEKIVAYLDKKITLIESCKCQRERELQTLNELKQAEIASVVTRGLNPNVPMKDSGIFWQPLIPDNWTVTKLKHVLSKLDRPRQPEDELLVCSNSGEVKKRGDSKLGLVADSDEIYQGVKRGDLLIHGMDTWHGAIAVSDYDGMCTPVVHVCDSTQNKKYIALYLRNMAYQKVFKLISNGVRQNTSDFRSWGKVGTILIPIPPIEEQDAIVEYIESKNSKIDKMIDALTAEIERLTEYKQRLISDVVTGQVDVRGEEIA